MKKNKGFTLVELLAVIVILAIIMIIAIPAVLDTVNKAKKKTFDEMAQKVYLAAEQKYIVLSGFGELIKPGGYDSIAYFFDIDKDLDIPSTGNIKGIVIFKLNMTNYRLKNSETGEFTTYEAGDIFVDIYLHDDSYSGSYFFSKKFGSDSYIYTLPPDFNVTEVPENEETTKENWVRFILDEHANSGEDYYYIDVVFVDAANNNILGECRPRVNHKYPI